MKKTITSTLLTIFLASILMYSCSIHTTVSTNRWLEYELPPSKIVKDGSVFFVGKLSGGSKFSVFYDDEINNDGEYYYAMLMQDLGWRRNSDTWSAPQYSHSIKRGHIYVNPGRRVAVYFYPERHFIAFKISIKTGS